MTTHTDRLPAVGQYAQEFNVTVQRILDMQRRGITHIAPDATVAQVLDSPEFEETGALVVSGDGRIVDGIISERDIARGLRRIGSD